MVWGGRGRASHPPECRAGTGSSLLALPSRAVASSRGPARRTWLSAKLRSLRGGPSSSRPAPGQIARRVHVWGSRGLNSASICPLQVAGLEFPTPASSQNRPGSIRSSVQALRAPQKSQRRRGAGFLSFFRGPGTKSAALPAVPLLSRPLPGVELDIQRASAGLGPYCGWGAAVRPACQAPPRRSVRCRRRRRVHHGAGAGQHAWAAAGPCTSHAAAAAAAASGGWRVRLRSRPGVPGKENVPPTGPADRSVWAREWRGSSGTIPFCYSSLHTALPPLLQVCPLQQDALVGGREATTAAAGRRQQGRRRQGPGAM